MNILLLGAAGFIGTNLSYKLLENNDNKLTLIDKSKDYVQKNIIVNKNVKFIETDINTYTDFNNLLQNQDLVYHLFSTTVPSTSNQRISQELVANVVMTSKMLEACVRKKIKKVVFLSSGGTVYGMETACPLNEKTATYPISSYGVQKVTIEKLLYLYNYLYGLDYRVIRLSNPYGPYQRPNGILGAVTTFTYKALMGETINVYGDGRVIRDFIYIDDAINGILKITDSDSTYKTFNLGSGKGTSISELLTIIRDTLNIPMNLEYEPSRKMDVPINYLDITRYEQIFGPLSAIDLADGIKKTADFMRMAYPTRY